MVNPVTPSRNIRVADELWTAAMAGAKADGSTVSAVINQFLLEAYGDGIHHYIITRGKGRVCSYCDVSETELREKNGGYDPTTIECNWFEDAGTGGE